MKTTIMKIFVLFAFVMTLANYASAAETIAVILKVQGQVYIVKSGGENKSAAKPKRGYRLENGDKLVTGKKSYAAVRFIDDASLVRVRSNSTCYIRGEKKNNEVLKNVYLEVGTILARVTKQKGKFEVSTPTSVASVKGTEWIIDQKFEGGTFYYGLEGIVELSNDAGSALLHEGETGYVASKDTPPTISKTKEGDVPGFDDDGDDIDFFQFEFENDAGQKKMLEFKSSGLTEEEE
ncbi:MAG: hypothetical protein E4H13_03110 [Calditrichales bacterium]|nr:MAG: hypothetical protein E4H13_03110 [Calditrichales bacterium]